MSKLVKLGSAELSAKLDELKSKRGLFEGRKVCILGDVGLDEYLLGDVRRISPEAPVPVIEVDQEDSRVGLAANVAQNIAALGAKAHLLGVVGDDEAAQRLSNLLKGRGVDQQHWVRDEGRPTTRKVRVMSGQHHLVRVDFERKSFLSPKAEAQLLTELESVLPLCELLVLQDYGKGILSENLCQEAIEFAKKQGIPVLVDPHRTTPIQCYRGADLIKPNRDEAFILSGLNLDELRMGPETILEVGQALREKSQAQRILITQGSDGVIIFDDSGVTQVPTLPRQVFDVTGAGDTFLAVLALSFAAGLDPVSAALFSNAASGVVVGKVGCHPCLPDELGEAMENYLNEEGF